jgi:hypothetical protein
MSHRLIQVAPPTPKPTLSGSTLSQKVMKGVFSFAARLNPFATLDWHGAQAVDNSSTSEKNAASTEQSNESTTTNNLYNLEDEKPVAQTLASQVEVGTTLVLIQQTTKSFVDHLTKESHRTDLEFSSLSCESTAVSSTSPRSAEKRSAFGIFVGSTEVN